MATLKEEVVLLVYLFQSANERRRWSVTDSHDLAFSALGLMRDLEDWEASISIWENRVIWAKGEWLRPHCEIIPALHSCDCTSLTGSSEAWFHSCWMDVVTQRFDKNHRGEASITVEFFSTKCIRMSLHTVTLHRNVALVTQLFFFYSFGDIFVVGSTIHKIMQRYY